MSEPTLYLSLALDFDTLTVVSAAYRFDGEVAKPFEGTVRLPKTMLKALRDGHRKSLIHQAELRKTIAEREELAARDANRKPPKHQDQDGTVRTLAGKPTDDIEPTKPIEEQMNLF